MRFERIRALREDNDHTQEQIAKLLHVNQRTYSRYETGERGIPVDVLINLANYYGVTVDYLVGRVDSPDSPPLSKKYADLEQARTGKLRPKKYGAPAQPKPDKQVSKKYDAPAQPKVRVADDPDDADDKEK